MVKRSKKSSLLTKYAQLYEKNPKSRVFAPLAESYRKLGMIDEALSVLKEGIKRHPTYVMGYNVLAHCYFDQQNYELAYNTVRPFVPQNLENISLQKLFAQICVNLGYLEEALQTFKHLLLLNPRDEYVSEQVKLLEDDLLVKEADVQIEPSRDVSFDDDEDEWVQVDFNREKKKIDIDETEGWEMESPSSAKLDIFKEEIKSSKLDVDEHSLDDDYYFEEYDDESAGLEPEEENEGDRPIITHTLVDLYIRQGHTDKAIEILESILETHPNDKPTQEKLAALKSESDSDEGLDLANLVEEKVKTSKEKQLKMLENKLTLFLQKIKKESKLHLNEV